MTEQTTPTPYVPDADEVITASLPRVPGAKGCDDGYDWMERLEGPWWPLAEFLGRMAGDWPDVVVAHYTDRRQECYGIAVWAEGEVSVRGYDSEEDRTAATLPYLQKD
ncbi:hypothetical protein [Streptomyces sp. IBSBF 2950]|uniref:hypothetical protein n=1 Tax=Streptomyces sp. IBSBF 2950 TaxID=2903528 RepID=UPI002FDC2C7F